jgi:hypothetical protein
MKTSKTWLLVALILIIVMLLTYLGIAFLTRKINPYDWSEGERFFLRSVGFFIILLSPLVYITIKD